MSMEKESLTHTIEEDLARRNRNWTKVEALEESLGEHFNRLQHYNAIQPVPYESGDNRWRDLIGVGFYYAGTVNVGYPTAGILIHFKLEITTITWQMFLGNSGTIWTRRVSSVANFADAEWVQV